MPKHARLAVFVCFLSFSNFIHADEPTQDELNAYLEGCKKGLSQAMPNRDHKDVEMICSDPYLNGKPNESAEDKARRMRLISEADKAKREMMERYIVNKDDIKPCFDSILSKEPGKDLKDVKMLCLNPYLTPTENETAADQARRKRLMKEADADKERMLDKFVVSPYRKNNAPTGSKR